MRYPPGQKEKTRAQILDAAASLFRSNGIQPTGLDGIMSAVGLTAGGFYAHFRSKDALVADAIDTAGARSYARWFGQFDHLRGRAFARALLRRYLSAEHRDERAEGCILPTLGAEMPRETRTNRRRFEQRLEAMFGHIAERTGSELGARRDQIVAAVALSVGGVVLSRAVTNRAFSNEILSASRRGAEQLLGLGQRGSARAQALGSSSSKRRRA